MPNGTDYGKTSCSYCDRKTSRAGFAVVNHGRMHARRKECIEVSYKEFWRHGNSDLMYVTVDAKLEGGKNGLDLSEWQINFNKSITQQIK